MKKQIVALVFLLLVCCIGTLAMDSDFTTENGVLTEYSDFEEDAVISNGILGSGSIIDIGDHAFRNDAIMLYSNSCVLSPELIQDGNSTVSLTPHVAVGTFHHNDNRKTPAGAQSIIINRENTTQETQDDSSSLKQRMWDYLFQDGQSDIKILIERSNYGYMNAVANYQTDLTFLRLLNAADHLIDTGTKPDKKMYISVLTNIIGLYDINHADSISVQKEKDHLKSAYSYGMDLVSIATNIVGSLDLEKGLQEELGAAIDGASVLLDNIDSWISEISALKILAQNYSAHDAFLALIEEQSDGELKEAAATVRTGLSELVKLRWNAYKNVGTETLVDLGAYFYSDYIFECFKQSQIYVTDTDVQFFVNSGERFVNAALRLGSAWNAGKEIGKLIGNLLVGGENLINRVMEMMSLYDVSCILQDKLLEYLIGFQKTENEETIRAFVSLSRYLVVTRIRGEYCLYNTAAKDGGILTWFQGQYGEEAKAWYESQSTRLLEISDKLNALLDAEESEPDEENRFDAPDFSAISNPFLDVPEGIYYYDAVMWAYGRDVTAGTSADHFSPSNLCTRAQVVTFLWRASGRPEPKSISNPFSDVHTSNYFYKAVLWAMEQGITNGTSSTTFSPHSSCTYAQVITFLWRANGQPRPQNVYGSKWYSESASWAYENDLLTIAAFRPEHPCPRAHIILYLYRNQTGNRMSPEAFIRDFRESNILGATLEDAVAEKNVGLSEWLNLYFQVFSDTSETYVPSVNDAVISGASFYEAVLANWGEEWLFQYYMSEREQPDISGNWIDEENEDGYHFFVMTIAQKNGVSYFDISRKSGYHWTFSGVWRDGALFYTDGVLTHRDETVYANGYGEMYLRGDSLLWIEKDLNGSYADGHLGEGEFVSYIGESVKYHKN